MTHFLHHNPSHPFLSPTFIPSPKPKPSPSPSPSPSRSFITFAEIPARDRIIDFGKYKGRMLGSLPSTYLKWVSSNLRARDFQEWAILADKVLKDPVYNDRLEWELAEKLLTGDTMATDHGAPVSELVETVSQRFGWDNEDSKGWSKVDFKLLGTSKGGRIPRAKEKKQDKLEVPVDRDSGGRRERLKMKKNDDDVGKRLSSSIRESLEGREEKIEGVYNPFPGREALLKKAFNRRKDI